MARTIAEITERSDRGDGPPCAVVIGAGNAGRDHGHVTGTLVPGEQTRMVWEFPPGARATDKLEIWFDGPFMPADRRLRCRIASQDTPHAPRATVDIAPGATVEVLIDGTRVGVADYTPNASGALGRIRISLAPHAASDTLRGAASEAAEWHIWLSLPDGAQASSTFHAWRERNDDPRRSILRDADLSSTLCDFACAPGAIVAGGIRSPGPAPEGSSHGHSQRAPSIFDHASRGPRPWSTGKAATEVPHVAAPADLVWGARSCAGDFTRTSGTSAAAAVVSGCIALLYQRAAAIGIRLGRDDLIMLLTGSPFQPPLMHARQRRRAWRPDLGFGTLRLHDDRQPHQLEGGSP